MDEQGGHGGDRGGRVGLIFLAAPPGGQGGSGHEGSCVGLAYGYAGWASFGYSLKQETPGRDQYQALRRRPTLATWGRRGLGSGHSPRI